MNATELDATELLTVARDDWWRDAVIYQIYPRSFADSNGDGIGDIPGMLEHADYFAWLGIDAVWLSPFYKSPQSDCGYDVEDYFDVDPMFGTLRDFEMLVQACHSRGLRVVVDIVPNHSSSRHAAFQAALKSAPGSPEREMYIFRDGQGPGGDLPPNNWGAPGSLWTRVSDDRGNPEQWYLHIFGVDQPDWNWENPQVVEMFDEILRFWLRLGVDGFRVDAACGLMKAPGLPDQRSGAEGLPIQTIDEETRPPMWDQDTVHDVYRRWNGVLREFGPDRMMVSEAWLEPERLKLYARPDEMQQAFNADLLQTRWDAKTLVRVIRNTIKQFAEVGALPTWVLSNHDIVRHTSRLVSDHWFEVRDGIGTTDPQPDGELGQRRGRAATMLMLSLPGAAYLYNGEELGLPEVTDLPDSVRQDYVFLESEGQRVGRDGCRVPMPWTRKGATFGFNNGSESWLPQPEWFADYSVEAELDDEQSTLHFYRSAIQLRDRYLLGSPQATVQRVGGAIVVSRRDSCSVTSIGPIESRVQVPSSMRPVLIVGDAPIELPDGNWAMKGDSAAWFVDPGDPQDAS